MGSHWLTKAGAQLDQPPCVAPPTGPGPQHCSGCRQGPKGPGDGPGGIEGSRLGPIQLSLPVAQFKNCTVTRCPPETSGRDPGSHPHVLSIRRSHHSAPQISRKPVLFPLSPPPPSSPWRQPWPPRCLPPPGTQRPQPRCHTCSISGLQRASRSCPVLCRPAAQTPLRFPPAGTVGTVLSHRDDCLSTPAPQAWSEASTQGNQAVDACSSRMRYFPGTLLIEVYFVNRLKEKTCILISKLLITHLIKTHQYF